MKITSVEFQEDGSYLVNKNVDENDAGQFSVPDDMGNRHRRKVQAWIDAGNTPTPYAEPEKSWVDKRTANMADGGYGTVTEQLEMIGEQGMDKFQTHIAKVKTDNPKG
jgi:hypothetical protein